MDLAARGKARYLRERGRINNPEKADVPTERLFERRSVSAFNFGSKTFLSFAVSNRIQAAKTGMNSAS